MKLDDSLGTGTEKWVGSNKKNMNHSQNIKEKRAKVTSTMVTCKISDGLENISAACQCSFMEFYFTLGRLFACPFTQNLLEKEDSVIDVCKNN